MIPPAPMDYRVALWESRTPPDLIVEGPTQKSPGLFVSGLTKLKASSSFRQAFTVVNRGWVTRSGHIFERFTSARTGFPQPGFLFSGE